MEPLRVRRVSRRRWAVELVVVCVRVRGGELRIRRTVKPRPQNDSVDTTRICPRWLSELAVSCWAALPQAVGRLLLRRGGRRRGRRGAPRAAAVHVARCSARSALRVGQRLRTIAA